MWISLVWHLSQLVGEWVRLVDLPDLMPEDGVATRALDLVIRDVLFVQETRGVLCVQDFGLFMALDALPFEGHDRLLDDVEMAFCRRPPVQYISGD